MAWQELEAAIRSTHKLSMSLRSSNVKGKAADVFLPLCSPLHYNCSWLSGVHTTASLKNSQPQGSDYDLPLQCNNSFTIGQKWQEDGEEIKPPLGEIKVESEEVVVVTTTPAPPKRKHKTNFPHTPAASFGGSSTKPKYPQNCPSFLKHNSMLRSTYNDCSLSFSFCPSSHRKLSTPWNTVSGSRLCFHLLKKQPGWYHNGISPSKLVALTYAC